MSGSNIAGALLYRAADPLAVSNRFNDLPIEVVAQIGETGLLGIQYYFNHFLQWEGPVAEGSASGWTLSGTTGAATITLSDIRNGAITLTADGTGSCNPTLALGSATVGMNFVYSVGKKLWMFARVKLVTVATTEVFLGFGTADTSPCVTGTQPSDGIFFHKASTDTKISFDARQNGTSTSKAAIGTTLVDDTYTILGFYVDSLGNINPSQDQVDLSGSQIAVGNANIPDAGADTMQFMVGILGASMTMTIDWLLLAQEL